MRVLLLVVLAVHALCMAQALSLEDGVTTEQQDTFETMTFEPQVTEEATIDPVELEALEQELAENNITLTNDQTVSYADITELADYYAQLQEELAQAQANSSSLRTVGGLPGGNAKKKLAFKAGSIITLAKIAVVMLALNSGVVRGTAAMSTTSSGITGSLSLQQDLPPFGESVIAGTLGGLTVGKHGLAIYEFGDTTMASCSALGGHYNPFMVAHSAPDSTFRHVGDLGNIVADSTGKAVVLIKDTTVKLVGPTSVIGRAIVVHAMEDDLGTGSTDESVTTGSAGQKIACGVIGRAEP